MIRLIAILAFLYGMSSCQNERDAVSNSREIKKQQDHDNVSDKDSSSIEKEMLVDSTEMTENMVEEPYVIGELEQRLMDMGLVNVHDIDSSIQVELKYSTGDNFLGEDVYGEFNRAYLQKDVAEKLSKAQAFLKEQDSTYSLLIYDAVRPRSVQQKMWNILDMPIEKKIKFVSNPINGSIHNYGAAVDLTIVAEDGTPLDMGAGFDDPSPEAWPVKEKEMLALGRIEEVHIKNRQLLRSVMGRAGFFNIQSEWWHFNSCYRARAKELYQIVE